MPNNRHFVVKTEKGYYSKSHRSHTSDINLARLYPTIRQALAHTPSSLGRNGVKDIIEVEVTVREIKKVTDDAL